MDKTGSTLFSRVSRSPARWDHEKSGIGVYSNQYSEQGSIPMYCLGWPGVNSEVKVPGKTQQVIEMDELLKIDDCPF